MAAKRRYSKASSRIAKRNRSKRIFNLSLRIAFPVVFFVGLVFLLRADFLQIKNFEVLGAEAVSSESVKNVAAVFVSGNKLFIIPKSDILLLNKNKLASALLSNFPRLEKVKINKQFFSKSVELSLTERKTDFLWCSPSNECFFMTKEGLVFEKLDPVQIPREKIIFRGNLTEAPLMKNFADAEKMQNYLKFIRFFEDAGFRINSINVESPDKAVAESDVGDIIFNPEEIDLSLPAQNAILLINDTKIKNPSARFNYIDTRFGNKIFYKLI